MNLTIGLWKRDDAWEQLLGQIGVSWSVVSHTEPLTPDTRTVVIVNAEIRQQREADRLHGFLSSGGSLLGDFGRLHRVLGCSTTSERYASILPQSFGPFAPASIVDVSAWGRLLKGCSGTPTTGSGPVQIVRAGNGVAASLPFDCSSLIRSTAYRRKNFYAHTDRLPSEYVSTVSKGPLREIVTKLLEYLHHVRALPFVHAWYYPDGKPSICTFRVDTDKGSRAELSELHDLCTHHGVRGTWFADVKSHEGWLGFFSDFSAQEIGLHCYEHRTDDTAEAVRSNFAKGMSLLRSAGFAVHGATAPTGRWNEAVDEVYRELGIGYSSEFSLAYDDLPSFPITARGRSTVLQLPIHPICVGSMRRSAFTSAQMKIYFRTWIDNRMQAREPVCLYHHPTHHHWEVFDDAFSYLRTLDIPCMTYGEYATWWTTRSKAVAAFTYDHGTIRSAAAHAPEIFYRVAFPGSEEIITEIDGALDTAAVPRRPMPPPVAQPADLMRVRAFDWRHIVLNTLDRWYTFRS